MSSTKHDWNTWENYLRVHERVLKDFASSILSSNPTYQLRQITENYYTLELNRLELLTIKGNSVFVKIEKDIHVKDGAKKKIAKLFNYSYHAWLKDPPRNLIRYCGPHLDHNKFHHRHDYTKSPMITTQVNKDNFPHVSDFLQEIIDTF
mgnify:CR=1 FL=1|tara:strand:+ start:201 stop:647 length:447 start_codon:yes stop_codon:yes gene_type:complete